APAQSAPAQATPPLQLHDLPPDPHTPTPAELAQERQQSTLNAAMRLATMQARWGPDMDSPGLSIALSEVHRTKTPQGATQITYHITGTGFSPDEKLLLVRWPLNSEAQTLMGGINFDPQGIAVCSGAPAPQPAPSSAPAATVPDASAQAAAPASGLTAAPAPNSAPQSSAVAAPPSCADTMQPHQPVEIQTTAAPGEAIRVAVMEEDRKHGAAVSTIPFPVSSTDQGCRLQIILGMKDAALVLIEGTGFPPNTPLKLDAITGDNTRPLHPRANAEGRIVVPLLTGAKGQTSGQTTVRFAGVNHTPTLDTSAAAPASPDPSCAPSVTFPWGDGSYKTE
ncbi:MAG: hypothetical protein WA476_16590, partial [Acidobacteriaceae bacterium]